MRRKLSPVLLALAMLFGIAVLAAPSASANPVYPGYHYVYNACESPGTIATRDVNYYMYPTPCHWTDDNASVTQFYNGSGTCVRVWALNGSGQWVVAGNVSDNQWYNVSWFDLYNKHRYVVTWRYGSVGVCQAI